jgi:hypothetical protein
VAVAIAKNPNFLTDPKNAQAAQEILASYNAPPYSHAGSNLSPQAWVILNSFVPHMPSVVTPHASQALTSSAPCAYAQPGSGNSDGVTTPIA